MPYLSRLVTNLLIAAAVSLVACSGGVYRQLHWANTDSEADWDIDSAVCLQHSETLTPQDHERIAEIKDAAAAVADAAGSLSSFYSDVSDSSDDDALSQLVSLIGLVGSGIASMQATTAEDKVKREKFAICLLDKGWGTQPNQAVAE